MQEHTRKKLCKDENALESNEEVIFKGTPQVRQAPSQTHIQPA